MERLCDPCDDRPVKSHPGPPHRPLDHSLLFPESLKRGPQYVPDWKLLRDHLQAEGRINKLDMIQLCALAAEALHKEPNVL